jgi:exonuclease III
MNWNVNNINSKGSELALGHLMTANAVDIVAITEVKLEADSTFAVDGYVTFSPQVGVAAKTRVLLLIRAEIASVSRLRQDLMDDSVQSIFVHVGAYERTWGGRTA